MEPIDVQQARIHEDGKTQRETMREKEKTKRTRIDALREPGPLVARFLFVVAVVSLGLVGYAAWSTYIEGKYGLKQCTDKAITELSAECPHPLQIGAMVGNTLVCTCPHVLAPTSHP
jgi:hypothetical protein